MIHDSLAGREKSMENQTNALNFFLNPQSVAVIGASAAAGKVGYAIIKNLLDSGFPGRIYPINPQIDEILGMKAYRSICDVPQRVDLAAIGIQPTLVPTVIQECATAGVKAALIMTAGFADAGDAGKRLQQEVVETARQGKVRLMGPNTQGVFNLKANSVTLSVPFPQSFVQDGPIAFVCQSALFPWHFVLKARHLGLSKMIDLGNMCDVSHAEALAYLGADPETKVIVLHIEGTPDGRFLLQTAAQVARQKPTIALKIGKTTAGGRAIASHTGSMTGRDEAYDAAFRQTGILRANDLDELMDMIKTFLCLPPVHGRRVGIVTTSGAGGAIAADACEEFGLEVVEFSQQTIQKLRDALPDWASINNPVDVWQVLDPLRLMSNFATALAALSSDPHVDAVAIVGHAPSVWPEFNITRILQEHAAKSIAKPVVIWTLGDEDGQRQLLPLERKGLVTYPDIRRAIKALASSYFYHQMREK